MGGQLQIVLGEDIQFHLFVLALAFGLLLGASVTMFVYWLEEKLREVLRDEGQR